MEETFSIIKCKKFSRASEEGSIQSLYAALRTELIVLNKTHRLWQFDKIMSDKCFLLASFTVL